ncbi:MAG: ketoacyl-ACP synthase III [Gemmatimonadaceae bacterium]|nr:ketoacyl-ACP synthase III [Gemmatimonadaceae bacterium]
MSPLGTIPAIAPVARPHAVIGGTGIALPSRVVTNAELSAQLGTDIDDFVRNTLGIVERRWCADGETSATLAVEACRRALDDAALAPMDVDLLVVATDTPEHISPATASVVQGRLGAARAGTFDVQSGCAGFVTALDVAWKYLRADARYRRILVVAVYTMSKWLDPHDKKTLTIFADGAGAVLVERSDAPGVLASELYADGTLAPGLGVFAGGSAEPITAAVLAAGDRNRLRFVQKYPASVNEDGWPRIAGSTLAQVGAGIHDVDLWLWTQVNRSTIVTVMARLGLPLERAHTVMHKWGYTGSACLPMALHDAREQQKLRDGDLVVLTGSGAGLSMGCVAMRWRDPARVRAERAGEGAS